MVSSSAFQLAVLSLTMPLHCSLEKLWDCVPLYNVIEKKAGRMVQIYLMCISIYLYLEV